MLSVLIVDDDIGDRKQLKRFLNASAIRCNIFESYEVAGGIDICCKQQIDCILLDYRMPDLSGIAAIQRFKLYSPDSIIIMVTGQGDEIVASEALKTGANDYLPKKNISTETIAYSINRAIEIDQIKRQSEEQRKNIESFSHVLAHDINAPLRSAAFYSKRIIQSLDKRLYEEAKVDAEEISNLISFLGSMIETLGEYNQANLLDFISQRVSLYEVILNVLRNLKAEIDHTSAKIVIDELPEVAGNMTLLTQLFQNLVANAIKYCDATPPTIHISSKETRGNWTIAIRDNGIGIPEKYRKTIFEPFKRINGGEHYQGSGLGLATCQTIAHRHHGSIYCDSQEGEGSTFFVELKQAPKFN